MERKQRILTTALWAVLVAVMMGVIGTGLWGKGWGGHDDAAPAVDPRPLQSYYPAATFALTNQDDKPTSDRDLRGHVYVCDFVFTHCAGPCKVMTEHMTKLQKQIADPSVRFVSFSVDPENDTPARLKEYAAGWGADPRWLLLTGTKDAMFAAAKGMKLAASPAEGEKLIFHDTHFLLVDATGQIRGSYDGQDAAALKQLAADVAKLTAEAATGQGPAQNTPAGRNEGTGQ